MEILTLAKLLPGKISNGSFLSMSHILAWRHNEEAEIREHMEIETKPGYRTKSINVFEAVPCGKM